MDYYLKFDSEAQAQQALLDCGAASLLPALLDEAGAVIRPAGLAPAPGVALVTVVIQRPTGNTIQTELGPQPELAAVPGWHVNVRTSLALPALTAYDMAPATPTQVWA